jgi:hypothetical protein
MNYFGNNVREMCVLQYCRQSRPNCKIILNKHSEQQSLAKLTISNQTEINFIVLLISHLTSGANKRFSTPMCAVSTCPHSSQLQWGSNRKTLC